MDHLVTVRCENAGQYVAEAVGLPDIRSEAATEAEAIEQVRQGLAQMVATSRLVRVSVPQSQSVENPWLTGHGRSADDPDFVEFEAELVRGRAVK
jgi:hypothetical protein